MTIRMLGAALAAIQLSAAASAAEFRVLDEAALKAAVTGKTVHLETPVGTLPISFKADGTMAGRSQDMAGYLGRSYDQGTWWISSNQLCQKWKLWLGGKSYCFTIRQDGAKVQWTRSDGLKGAMTVSN